MEPVCRGPWGGGQSPGCLPDPQGGQICKLRERRTPGPKILAGYCGGDFNLQGAGRGWWYGCELATARPVPYGVNEQAPELRAAPSNPRTAEAPLKPSPRRGTRGGAARPRSPLPPPAGAPARRELRGARRGPRPGCCSPELELKITPSLGRAG